MIFDFVQRSLSHADTWKMNDSKWHTELCSRAAWSSPEPVTHSSTFISSVTVHKSVIKSWFRSQSKSKWQWPSKQIAQSKWHCCCFETTNISSVTAYLHPSATYCPSVTSGNLWRGKETSEDLTSVVAMSRYVLRVLAKGGLSLFRSQRGLKSRLF